MLNQFSRTELLLGKEAMDKLENARVPPVWQYLESEELEVMYVKHWSEAA